MENFCGTCGTVENFPEDTRSELRPYGAGGAAICYRCAFTDDATAERTKNNFYAIADASIAATGVHVIGGDA